MLVPLLQNNQQITARQSADKPNIITDYGLHAGGSLPYIGKPDRYKVNVKVKINDIWYETIQIVDDNEAMVWAQLNNVTKFKTNDIVITVSSVRAFDPTIQVKVNYKLPLAKDPTVSSVPMSTRSYLDSSILMTKFSRCIDERTLPAIPSGINFS